MNPRAHHPAAPTRPTHPDPTTDTPPGTTRANGTTLPTSVGGATDTVGPDTATARPTSRAGASGPDTTTVPDTTHPTLRPGASVAGTGAAAPGPGPMAPLSPVSLAAVVEAFVLAPPPPDLPELLRARPDPLDPEKVELSHRPTPGGCHPVDALALLDTDPGWLAVGIRALGRATPLDGGPGTRVISAHLVGRDGAWASAWRDAGGSGVGSSAHGTAGDPAAPTGRVDDACRRALGLPTAPPPPSTAELWSLLWLDALVADLASSERRRATVRWSDVAAMHPAATPDGATWDGQQGPTPDEVSAAAQELTRSLDWPELRRRAAHHEWDAPGVEPPMAAWLDDGAFARWVSTSFPELDDLAAAAESLLPARVWARVEAALRR